MYKTCLERREDAVKVCIPTQPILLSDELYKRPIKIKNYKYNVFIFFFHFQPIACPDFYDNDNKINFISVLSCLYSGNICQKYVNLYYVQ